MVQLVNESPQSGHFVSDAVGDADVRRKDMVGDGLRQMVLEWDLFLPAAFVELTWRRVEKKGFPTCWKLGPHSVEIMGGERLVGDGRQSRSCGACVGQASTVMAVRLDRVLSSRAASSMDRVRERNVLDHISARAERLICGGQWRS